VVGNGTLGFAGDGLPATAAELDHPFGVWVDGSENIIFTDLGNHRVREVSGQQVLFYHSWNGIQWFLL